MSGERWLLTVAGVEHEVEVSEVGLRREVVWRVGGVEAARGRTGEKRLVLGSEGSGGLLVRLSELGGPARRVTLFDTHEEALLGVGGVDLDPAPGTAAARREAWIRAHPHQYAVRRGLAAAAGVVLPILLVWLLARFALPAIPWPDWHLPRIPWPDLPRMPWPDIAWPDIPWPDLPSWSLPEWLRSALEKAKYVWPVLLAVGLAQAEVRRRRRQDQEKRVQGESTT